MKTVIFNADVGEAAGFDAEIMPYISWCNIACGAHAGDELSIRNTIDLAMEHGVQIGAHPSYPDRANFGRVVMDITDAALRASVEAQILKVRHWVEKAGGKLHHVKPHGALYNAAAVNPQLAALLITTLKNIDSTIAIIAPHRSAMATAAKGEIAIRYEAFADRNYNEDLSLVARTTANAVLETPEAVWAHVQQMVVHQQVTTHTGKQRPIAFDTICVHGDTSGAVQLLAYVSAQLAQLGYKTR